MCCVTRGWWGQCCFPPNRVKKITRSTCLETINPILREHDFSEVSGMMLVCVGFGEMLNPAWRKAPVCALGSFPASQIFIPRFSSLLLLQEAHIDGFVDDGLRKE